MSMSKPEHASSFTSPNGRGRRVAPGEGLQPHDRPYPLTPTLSHRSRIYPTSTYWDAQLGYSRVGWERGRASVVARLSFIGDQDMSKFTDIGVEKVGHVGTIEIQRPPLNFFDISLINQIADALEEFDKDIEIRCSVLMAQGKAFCAGANFNDPARQEQEARAAKGDPADSLGPINSLYLHAVRIFRNKKPIVAAVHGAAIGGGLGLAVSADFRVTCPEARFAANFTKLGFHPGF